MDIGKQKHTGGELWRYCGFGRLMDIGKQKLQANNYNPNNGFGRLMDIGKQKPLLATTGARSVLVVWWILVNRN